jgi:hypothetical protein
MLNYTKSKSGRASAVLTTGEVAGTALSLIGIRGQLVTVDLSFTIGSLTNVTVRFYASMDGTTYDQININGTNMQEVLTASSERCYVVPALPGWKWFRVSVQGSGTVTSSLCDFTYRWEKPGVYI